MNYCSIILILAVFISLILRNLQPCHLESSFILLPLNRDLIQEHQQILMLFLDLLPLNFRILQLFCERFDLLLKVLQLSRLCNVNNGQITSRMELPGHVTTKTPLDVSPEYQSLLIVDELHPGEKLSVSVFQRFVLSERVGDVR